MTVDAFRERCGTSTKTVKSWIENGYVPGANWDADYVPDSARPPFTEARAKSKCSNSVFASIVKATLKRKHVLPELYGMCQEEFDGYINQLVEAGLIRIRITDGITYYDPTLQAEQQSKSEIKQLIKECVEVASRGAMSACLENIGA